ncbi:MAG: PhoH family protein [Lactobacillaceae bacterium]|jgi:phosphate starvation-inducible PhoH-like protein|nr:PhoH family protein [Lactobacillaceae bacterium]
MTQIINFQSNKQLQDLFGTSDQLIKLIEESLDVKISVIGNQIEINGAENAEKASKQVIDVLSGLSRKNITIGPFDVISAINMQERGTLEYFSDFYNEVIINDAKNRPVRIKNFTQRKYIQSIKKNDITFGIGPAGTGKTYLAVAMAVSLFKKGEVDRIIISRPAVEAGESLGFLPGDLKEKVDPYLRPIYDAMDSLLGGDTANRFMERGLIEVAPLAYMRGRTLDNAFVILDEGQNTTPNQMKMFLTRLGFNSKMLINGDISQIDLPRGEKASGLSQAQRILKDVPGVEFVNFGSQDVVRHPVVGKIVEAYERSENHD